MAGLVGILRQRMKMLIEDAAAVSQVVEDAFAGQSELDDDRLDKDLRQVFYSLQDEKILDIRREERTDERGEAKRHYLWRVRDDAGPDEASPRVLSEEERLYLRLRDEAWERKHPEVQ